jgi:soluble lytic murein transglycosylase
MTWSYWVTLIPDRWPSSVFSVILALPLCAADPLDAPSHAYRKANTPAARAALEAHSTRAGVLVRLALGASDLRHGRLTEGLANLDAARAGLPKIADHADFAAAETMVGMKWDAEALPRLERVIAMQPVSPHRGQALTYAAEILLAAGEPRRALDLIKPFSNYLQHPRGVFAYGAALDAAGQPASAVMQLQRVYYDHPNSIEAVKAEVILRRIKSQLGAAYPPALGRTMLARTQRIIDAGDPRRAMEELIAMEPHLGGAERELARVRLGAAMFHMRDYKGAIRHLRSIQPESAEADGERLYYWLSAERRLDSDIGISEVLAEFERRQPASSWRAQALTDVANRALVNNQSDIFEPLYQSCSLSAAGSSKGAYCHFRMAWSRYLKRDARAPQLFREHLDRFPGSEDTAASLYFLARISEEKSDLPSARALYETIDRTFPNYYYAMTARERLASPQLRAVSPNPSATAGLRLRPAGAPPDFETDSATSFRLERARLLDQAGLEDWAEAELRFAGRADAKPHVVAIELASIMTQQGRPDQALRYVKSFANGYLGWALDKAPLSFWRAAFPLPYHDSLDRYSAERQLDPHLVAGLIRQESEFDPKAVSSAKAIGLTQILPLTGRDLSRRLGVRYFTTAMLQQPDYNLRLGTYYLRSLLDSLQKNWVAVLAAYNAGKSRADMWLRWGDFREPAEFIESIPFSETRNYVQIVMRNADMYRRLYGERKITVTPAPAAPQASAGAVAHPPAKKQTR